MDRLSLSHLPSYHLSHFPHLPLLCDIQLLQARLRLFLQVGLPSKPAHLCQGCLRGLCVDKRVNGYVIISEVQKNPPKKPKRLFDKCMSAWRACADIQYVNISGLAPHSTVELTWMFVWVLWSRSVWFSSSADLFIAIATSCSTSRSSRSCSISKCWGNITSGTLLQAHLGLGWPQAVVTDYYSVTTAKSIKSFIGALLYIKSF